ncbi:hypothetical protein FC96_GL001234 [Secundilactobacillus kimchicus JCM 15530]|uniref:DUF2975 domain-containing protein n=1 Tax=Secundilactobacillus kimchicus JCM 15530 TaxID=1302272 RepID=A0A0R1HZ43_9LACO|nr:DUF2975 domain-containing protein [Secundilactobacillus kimchicus]KRK48913.1 hypothetical protein FC96_GL001234 [Secundilactobacillus kimchicus JCM 15530]
MKSRMMKLVSLIACVSLMAVGGLTTHSLWQVAARTGTHRLVSQALLVGGLVLLVCGTLFCTIQVWRLFSIVNLETTFRYQTLTVLNWLKRGALVMTAGLLVDWWPVYIVADKTDAPGMILILVIVTILVGSISVLAAIFQDVLITSHILSRDSGEH